ncbi:MAG: hypothetical protein KGH59_01335 [Candidatus Micrarchaeota archaeon]|nr:hypothetical protein [Candidatus Micrarchaeota archaeon]
MAEQGDFDWELHPDLEKFVVGEVNSFLSKNAFAKQLSDRMLSETSTRFIDWVDHIIIPESRAGYDSLERIGLREEKSEGAPDGSRVFRHPRSYLFPILTCESDVTELSIKPESIEDFLQVFGNGINADGEPFAPLRKAEVKRDGDTLLCAVERRGYGGFVVKESSDTSNYLNALGAMFERKRHFEEDSEGMQEVVETISSLSGKLATARLSDAFFRSERAYWQRRNRAGQVQKARQDALGLGWGNHDHHTYRSSRANFVGMIRIFESMGYKCREKYYAGEKAGWGAQILEHRECDIVVFTDVDLNPDETEIDFAHRGFEERETKMGTVGLWVGLHGESILQAGMHHLEARFDHEKLTADLPKYGVSVMPPFSHFEFLKQAFTAGEMWKVEKRRLDRLLADGFITKEQYGAFERDGAIGSHMENLERDQGFKGFNRSSVTKIIMETDPRKQHFAGA